MSEKTETTYLIAPSQPAADQHEIPENVEPTSDLDKARSRYAAISFDMSDQTPPEKPEKEPLSKEIGSQTLKRKHGISGPCRCMTFAEGQLIFLLVVAIIVIIIMTCIIFIMKAKTNYCITSDCAYQAGKQVAVMDLKANPCTNFYQYACGNWANVYQPEPGVGKYSNFYRATMKADKRIYQLLTKDDKTLYGKKSTAIEKVKTFFSSCMNMTQRDKVGNTPLINMIKELGGWSITSNAPRDKTKWDFIQIMAKLNAYGVSPFFSVAPMVNPKDSSGYLWTFSPAKPFFSRAEMLSSDTKYKHAFLQFGVTIGKLLGNSHSVNLHTLFTEIWDLEVALTKKTLPLVESRDPGRVNNIMTLSNFGSSILKNRFDVATLMQNILGKSFYPGVLVNVRDVDYFREMEKLLQTVKSDVKANYMMFKMVELYAAKLGYAFQEAYSIKKLAVVGSAVMNQDWKTCLLLTVNLLPTPVAALYAENFSNKSDITKVTDMVQKVKAQLIATISKADWMDQLTKSRAIAKARNILYRVGYPKSVYNVTDLDKEYKSLSLETKDFFENYRRVKKFLSKTEIDNPPSLKTRLQFHMPPTKANAYYTNDEVSITILGGILQYPFFNRRFNPAANYGSLGSIIGHELSHGFDSKGAKFDEKGNLANWWTSATQQMFAKKRDCFVGQYSNYTYLGLHNKGTLTIGENMADNAGILLSFYAFQEYQQVEASNFRGFLPGAELSDEQVFFLSFAQTYCGYYTPTFGRHLMTTDAHSVYPHRVLGTLSNIPEFSKSFKCKKGEPYNPAHRCKLW